MAVDTKLEDLPEELLCGMLSRLPMRDAARACASCSTLLRVWRMHAHLVFDEDTLGLRLLSEEEIELLDDDGDLDPHRRAVLEKKKDELASDFVRFVDATMLRHRSDTALETLSVKFAYLQQRHAAMVDRWVHFAMESTTVRRLELDFVAFYEEPCGPDTLCYDFPSSLLLHPCRGAMALEQLHLRSGCLRWPPSFSLSSTSTGTSSTYVGLTSLVLDTVRVTGQDLERFLSSCHKLRRLELNCCDDRVHVKVPPSCLFLALRHCRSLETVDSRVASLTFETTNSRQPSILGSAVPAPSVTRASFCMMTNLSEADPGNGIFECTSLARLMPGIESLSLIVSMLVKVVTPPSTWKFRHLKRLDLWMCLNGKARQRDDFIFLHRFLHAAPALESLSLHVWSSATAFDASGMPTRVEQQHPSSPHLSLKTVTITGFDAHLGFLELVLHILENARPLQRLSLDPAWYDVDTQMPLMTKPPEFRRQLAREAIARHIAPRISPDIALEVF